MWLHAPYSQLEHRSQRNQWIWLDRTAKGQTVLHWYHGKEANLWLGTSPWWAHWQLLICRLLLGLPAPQQTSLPVVKRRNIRASPTRIFFSQSQWNPTVRWMPVLCPSSPLWANAWRAPPATCARCHISSKDSRSLYSVQFGLNTRELCFRGPHRL